jgi:DNA polymerase-3 subunit delta'
MMASNQVQRFIREALLQGRFSHAYIVAGVFDHLFTQSVAQTIMCKQEHRGCGSCSSCLKLKSNNHPDIIWVEPDGASIKIAQIETVQSFIHIRPFESNYKVIIFEQAHLMTEQAQNRLLKVLEEPPGYVVIFFVTENVESLLETVRSRCQVIGSDEVTIFSKDVDFEKAVDFVLSLEYKDAGRIFEYGAFYKKEKQRFAVFLNHLTVLLRDVLVIKETGNKTLLHPQNLTILEERTQLSRLSASVDKKQLLDMIFLIDDLQAKIKANMNYEMTLDRLLFQCLKN